MPNQEIKFIITGTEGTGKTAAIESMRGFLPVELKADKDNQTTTVGAEYCQLDFDNGIVLKLFAFPGQKRFSFVWKPLSHDANGLIILVDNTRETPLADLEIYLENFGALINRTAAVVGVIKSEEGPGPKLTDYQKFLTERGNDIPVLVTDVRVADNMLKLIDALLSQLDKNE